MSTSYAREMYNNNNNNNLRLLQLQSNATTEPTSDTQDSTDTIEHKASIYFIWFKTKQSGLPGYLYDRLHDYQPSRTLRSSTAYQLQRPPLTTSFADRSFAVTAPTVWNSLSLSTRSANTFGTFKSCLKTELFMSAYTTQSVSAPSQRYRFTCDFMRFTNVLQIRLDQHPAARLTSLQWLTDRSV